MPDRCPSPGPGPGLAGLVPESGADPARPVAPLPPSAGSDLARLLLRDPGRSVLMRVRGDSMREAGIRHGDLLLVERRRARIGEVVVARLRSGLTLKRLVRRRGRWWLVAAHPAYPPLALGSGRLWGVAIHRIRGLQPSGEAAISADGASGGAPQPEASATAGAGDQAREPGR